MRRLVLLLFGLLCLGVVLPPQAAWAVPSNAVRKRAKSKGDDEAKKRKKPRRKPAARRVIPKPRPAPRRRPVRRAPAPRPRPAPRAAPRPHPRAEPPARRATPRPRARQPDHDRDDARRRSRARWERTRRRVLDATRRRSTYPAPVTIYVAPSPEPTPAPAPAPAVAPAPTVYQGTGDIPPAALQRALTVEGGTAHGPIAPGQAGPIRIPTTVLTPAPREPGALTGHAAEGLEDVAGSAPTPFVEALHVDASWSHWTYSPVADDGPIDTRVGFTTVEEYDIEAIDLYRVALTLDTRYASIALSYATNQGFAVGDGQASLLDLVVHFAGVEYLDRLRFEFQTLDFDHGEARLLERDGGALIQRAAFDVQMTWGEVRYSFLPPVYVFGRLTRHALPRNVYLVEEGTRSQGLRTQISDQLLQVDHTVAFLGLGLGTDERERPPLIAGVKGGLGYGGYTLSSVVGGEQFDEGNLTAGLVEVTLGYRLALGEHFALGLRDDLTLQLLTPTGLPDDMRRAVEAAGADPDGFALTFGQADVVNRFSMFFEITL